MSTIKCIICNGEIHHQGEDPTAVYRTHLTQTHQLSYAIASIFQTLQETLRNSKENLAARPLIDVACQADLIADVPRLQRMSNSPSNLVETSFLPINVDKPRENTLATPATSCKPIRPDEITLTPSFSQESSLMRQQPSSNSKGKRNLSSSGASNGAMDAEKGSKRSRLAPSSCEGSVNDVPVKMNKPSNHEGSHFENGSQIREKANISGKEASNQNVKENHNSATKPASGRIVRLKLPYFYGCEYQCQVCYLMFHHVEDLRIHVKTHGKVNEYLDKYSCFETKAVFWDCVSCGMSVKQNYAAINNHIEEDHPMLTINSLPKAYNIPYFHEVDIDCRFVENPGVDTVQNCLAETTPQESIEIFNQVDESTIKCSNSSIDASILRKKPGNSSIEASASFTKEKESSENDKTGNTACILKSSIIEQNSPVKKASATKEPKKSNDSMLSSFKAFKAGSCLFECQICMFKSPNKLNFGFHLRREHHLSTQDYIGKHGDPCIKKELYTCDLCGHEILHEYTTMRGHSFMKHKLIMKDYFQKLCAYRNHMVNGKKNELTLGSLRFDDWVNKCSYSCMICTKIYKTKNQSKLHQKQDHKSIESLKIKSNIVQHECKICKISVLHHKASLTAHCRNSHDGLTLKEYFDTFIQPKISTSSNDINKGTSQMSVRNLKNANSRGVPDEKETTVQNIKKSRKMHKIFINKESTDWSVSKCTLCNAKFSSQRKAMKHLGTNHNSSDKKHLEAIARSDYQCKLCNKKIIYKACFIAIHMRKVHNLSLAQYSQKVLAHQPPVSPLKQGST